MNSVQIFPVDLQGSGAFNGGEIVENKPIGFPSDGSLLKPYSNLFYWAHARANTDSTIGLHPHQGFEIASFVLKGSIRHYDTGLRDWRGLQEGDVQIIRAGSGISHSEWLGADSEIFQIWFDPDLRKTLAQPASYDDYRASEFTSREEGSAAITTLAGPGSPLRMDTPGIRIERIRLAPGTLSIPVSVSETTSLYVLSGRIAVNGSWAETRTFALVRDMDKVVLTADAPTEVFVIVSPTVPGYRTYARA
jgi:redox-sensitive bicupin YhaK (pirin superfamily)